MGAGKTTFVRGLARGLGVKITPRSPTFALIRDYGAFVHADLYRVAPRDISGLGLDDYFDAGRIIAVEWGGRAAPGFWRGLTVILLNFVIAGGTKRTITLTESDDLPAAVGEAWERFRCDS